MLAGCGRQPDSRAGDQLEKTEAKTLFRKAKTTFSINYDANQEKVLKEVRDTWRIISKPDQKTEKENKRILR